MGNRSRRRAAMARELSKFLLNKSTFNQAINNIKQESRKNHFFLSELTERPLFKDEKGNCIGLYEEAKDGKMKLVYSDEKGIPILNNKGIPKFVKATDATFHSGGINWEYSHLTYKHHQLIKEADELTEQLVNINKIIQKNKHLEKSSLIQKKINKIKAQEEELRFEAGKTLSEMTNFFLEKTTKINNTKRHSEVQIRNYKHLIIKGIDSRLITQINKSVVNTSKLINDKSSKKDLKDIKKLNKKNIFVELDRNIFQMYDHAKKLAFSLRLITDNTKHEMDLISKNINDLRRKNNLDSYIEEDKKELGEDFKLFKGISYRINLHSNWLSKAVNDLISCISMHEFEKELLEENSFHGKKLNEFFKIYNNLLTIENDIYQEIKYLGKHHKTLKKILGKHYKKIKNNLSKIKDTQNYSKLDLVDNLRGTGRNIYKGTIVLFVLATLTSSILTVLGVGSIFCTTGIFASKIFTGITGGTGFLSMIVENLPSLGHKIAEWSVVGA